MLTTSSLGLFFSGGWEHFLEVLIVLFLDCVLGVTVIAQLIFMEIMHSKPAVKPLRIITIGLTGINLGGGVIQFLFAGWFLSLWVTYSADFNFIFLICVVSVLVLAVVGFFGMKFIKKNQPVTAQA